jgi:hypothetical protein
MRARLDETKEGGGGLGRWRTVNGGVIFGFSSSSHPLEECSPPLFLGIIRGGRQPDWKIPWFWDDGRFLGVAPLPSPLPTLPRFPRRAVIWLSGQPPSFVFAFFFLLLVVEVFFYPVSFWISLLFLHLWAFGETGSEAGGVIEMASIGIFLFSEIFLSPC